MPEANSLPSPLVYDNSSPCQCIGDYSVSPTEVRPGDKLEFNINIQDKTGTICGACSIGVTIGCSFAVDAEWEGLGDHDGGTSVLSCEQDTFGESSTIFSFSGAWGDWLVENDLLDLKPYDPEYPRSHKFTFTIDGSAGPTGECPSYVRVGGEPGPYAYAGHNYWILSCPFNILGGACGPNAKERQEEKRCPCECSATNSLTGKSDYEAARVGGIPLRCSSTQAGASSTHGMGGGWYWGNGLQSKVTVTSGEAQIDHGDGSFDNYGDFSGGPAGGLHCDNYSVIEDNTTVYTVTDKGQTDWNYNPTSGLLTSVVDRNGRTLTVNRDSGNNDRIDDVDDGRGRVLFFDYDTRTDGQPRFIYENDDTSGRMWELTYNGSGLLASIINPEGETTSFTYDGSGRLWKVTDPRGELALTLTYHSSGYADGKVWVETIYDQQTNTFTYAEDGDGNLTTTVVSQDIATSPTPASRTSVYELDKRRALVKMTDPLNNVHEYKYLDINSPYLLSRYIDPNNNVTAYIYDDDGNVTKIVTGTDEQMSMGDETTFEYLDGTNGPNPNAKQKNLVWKITRPEVSVGGTPTTYAPTEFRYDSDGNLTEIRDALYATHNQKTLIEYETTTGLEGEIKSITDRNGNKTDFTYYLWNPSTPDPNGRNGGNLKEVKSPSGPNSAPQRVVTFKYDDYDNVIEVEDHDGNIWETEWDDVDRPTKLTDARSKFTNLNYVNGLLDYIEAPTNNGSGANRRKTEFTYDDSSRMTKTESYIGVSTKQMRVRYEFDGHSNLTKLVRLLGGSETDGTLYEHDKLNRLTKVTDPESRITTIAPQPFCGGMTETTARGVVRDYSMDHLCRLTELNTGTDSDNPVNEKHEFEFDELGRLTKVIQTEVTRYDGSGSPPRVKRRFGSGRYSKAGDPPTYPTEEREFEYDALDRLTKVTFPGTETIEYEYDYEGNLTKMTDTEGNETEYSYYNDNRLYEVTIVRPAQSDRVFTYTYDAAGRLDKIVYPSETGIEVHFDDGASGSGWNENGQLVQMRYVKDDGMSGFDAVVSFEYEYDDSGNRTAMVEDNGVPAEKIRWEYSYDWLDRLVEVKRGVGASPTMATQRVYEYDESDNRTYMDDHLSSTSFRYVYNDADELEKVQEADGADFESRTPGDYSDAELFTHDADGNMTSRTKNSNTTKYEWDDFNRLIAVEHPSGAKVVNLYDAEDLRKEKVLSTGEKVKSFFAGAQTGSESSSTFDTFAFLMAHQLLGVEKNGTFNYFITDGLTSVRLVLNDSGGEIASYEHDEFGNQLVKTGSGSSPKTFVGGLGVHDDADVSGLLYMRARHYDAKLGRFLSRDPIGISGGLNLYSYVRSNPVNRVDPSGLSPAVDPRVSEIIAAIKKKTATQKCRKAVDRLRGFCNASRDQRTDVPRENVLDSILKLSNVKYETAAGQHKDSFTENFPASPAVEPGTFTPEQLRANPELVKFTRPQPNRSRIVLAGDLGVPGQPISDSVLEIAFHEILHLTQVGHSNADPYFLQGEAFMIHVARVCLGTSGRHGGTSYRGTELYWNNKWSNFPELQQAIDENPLD